MVAWMWFPSTPFKFLTSTNNFSINDHYWFVNGRQSMGAFGHRFAALIWSRVCDNLNQSICDIDWIANDLIRICYCQDSKIWCLPMEKKDPDAITTLKLIWQLDLTPVPFWYNLGSGFGQIWVPVFGRRSRLSTIKGLAYWWQLLWLSKLLIYFLNFKFHFEFKLSRWSLLSIKFTDFKVWLAARLRPFSVHFWTIFDLIQQMKAIRLEYDHTIIISNFCHRYVVRPDTNEFPYLG